VDPENWGFAGILTPEYREQAKATKRKSIPS